MRHVFLSQSHFSIWYLSTSFQSTCHGYLQTQQKSVAHQLNSAFNTDGNEYHRSSCDSGVSAFVSIFSCSFLVPSSNGDDMSSTSGKGGLSVNLWPSDTDEFLPMMRDETDSKPGW